LTTCISHFRVRYAETDNMGVAYHANYLVWYEVGRTDLIRQLGFPYKEMERRGVFLPVIDVQCSYLKPVHYDDELELHSSLEERSGVRLRISYRLYRDRMLMATGQTIHAFTDRDGKPHRPPDDMLLAMTRGTTL
jgi:acyl-CoA thioester hydrolase